MISVCSPDAATFIRPPWGLEPSAFRHQRSAGCLLPRATSADTSPWQRAAAEFRPARFRPAVGRRTSGRLGDERLAVAAGVDRPLDDLAAAARSRRRRRDELLAVRAHL